MFAAKGGNVKAMKKWNGTTDYADFRGSREGREECEGKKKRRGAKMERRG
jgi:hypothetical protein